MRKLIVEISDTLHDSLKKTAAMNSVTIKEIVITLIDNFLEKKKSRPVTNTGFCGKWKDERSAKQIINDIKTHRKWMLEQPGKTKKM